MNSTSKIQRISYWVLIAAVALIFFMSGIMKFTNNEEIINNFSKWNLLDYKIWIGIIECLLVIAYLMPKTNLLGALGFTGVMIGASYTHYIHQEPFYFQVAIVLVIWINYLLVKPKKQIQ